MFPSLLPCHSIDYRGRQLLNGPFLVYVFFLFSPNSSLFPTSRLPLLRVFLRFLTSFPPSLFPSPFPSSSQFPSSLLLSFPSPPLSSFHSCVSPWVSTPSPVPVPVPAPSPLPSPSISCVRCSPPPLFSFLLRPRSHHRSRHRSRPNRCSPRPCFRLRSRPRLLFRPRPRSCIPVFWTRLLPRYDARVQAPGLASGAVGCPQALPPAWRYIMRAE